LTLLAGSNVLEFICYPQADFTTSIIYRLYPLTYLCFAALGYYLIVGRLKVNDLIYHMKPEFYLLLVCLMVICYLKYTNNLDAFSFLLNTLCLPAILSILLKSTDQNILQRSRKCVYGVFFLNALMAIIEKFKGSALLGSESHHFLFFRSSALYGHPLNNALIMSVLTIVLFYGTDNRKLKITVLLTGMISLFCFGARGGMIGVFLGITINTILNILGYGEEEDNYLKMKKGLLSLIGFGIAFFMIANFTHLGGRIAALSFMDSSAQVRMKTLDVLNGLNLQDLLWGFSPEKIKYLQYISGVPIIENFWLFCLLKFGLVVTMLLASALIFFLYRSMEYISKDIKLTILFVFLFVASTNNSLATSTLVLSILIFSIYIIFNNEDLQNHTLVENDFHLSKKYSV